uniref:Uncharacterized protein n=1 Tax=Tanacetum cinerariifolium TaxID=118510 RepID=A0A6L2LLL6_TANCI|nr:hypothetical protein [Tanacetum cinerariifolium]
MEEYIRLEEEKARRRGKVYNWETTTYGMIWDNEDVHDLGSVKTEFPAIVFNDALTSEAALSYEPTGRSQVRVPPGTFTPSGGIGGSTGEFRLIRGGSEQSHVSIPSLRVCMCGLCRPPGILIPICYDDDDSEESSTPLRDIIISELPPCIAITPVLSTKETKDSLIMRDEHLDTIPEKESDEFIKSSIENLVPNPSESEDLYNIGRECDVSICDDFTTFSNLLFDADDNFSSSDDKSFSNEDVPKEIYSNPLFDEETISIMIDSHHFSAESNLIEYLLNQDSSIISSSKIDSLLNEFAGKLIFLKSIPPGIDEADCDPEEEIRLIEKLLYDNSSPRPPGEINSENSNAVIESFSPSPIPIEDSDPFMKEINLFLTSDGSIPPGIDSDYSDSERDNLFPERLLHDDPIPLSDILDSLNVVRIFPPFFTYPVTSSILFSFGSEDIIFDPGISNYHFSSFMSGVSHRSGTFMKFNVYLNHLNESLMEILSSTCSLIDQ